MLRTLLAAMTALTLMSVIGTPGVGFAQPYSASTTETTTVAPPRHNMDETTTMRRTENRDGVLIEKDTSGTEVTRPGEVTTSRTTTETNAPDEEVTTTRSTTVR